MKREVAERLFSSMAAPRLSSALSFGLSSEGLFRCVTLGLPLRLYVASGSFTGWLGSLPGGESANVQQGRIREERGNQTRCPIDCKEADPSSQGREKEKRPDRLVYVDVDTNFPEREIARFCSFWLVCHPNAIGLNSTGQLDPPPSTAAPLSSQRNSTRGRRRREAKERLPLSLPVSFFLPFPFLSACMLSLHRQTKRGVDEPSRSSSCATNNSLSTQMDRFSACPSPVKQLCRTLFLGTAVAHFFLLL